MEWFLALAPVAALSVFCGVQFCSYRFGKISLMRSIVVGFVLGFCLLIFGDLLLSKTGQLSVALPTYAFLSFGYFNFISLGETSMRVRLLREIQKFPEGVSMEQLEQRYNGRLVLEARLERLKRSDQVAFDGVRFYPKISVLYVISQIIPIVRVIILGSKNVGAELEGTWDHG